MNTTALVDIKEGDLIQFYALLKTDIINLSRKEHEKLLNASKFILYQKRMMGNHFITINIPMDLFILLKGYGKIN
jgi:hypothetical protein